MARQISLLEGDCESCPEGHPTHCVNVFTPITLAYDNGNGGAFSGSVAPGALFLSGDSTYTVTSWIVDGAEMITTPTVLGPYPPGGAGYDAYFADLGALLTSLDPNGLTWSMFVGQLPLYHFRHLRATVPCDVAQISEYGPITSTRVWDKGSKTYTQFVGNKPSEQIGCYERIVTDCPDEQGNGFEFLIIDTETGLYLDLDALAAEYGTEICVARCEKGFPESPAEGITCETEQQRACCEDSDGVKTPIILDTVVCTDINGVITRDSAVYDEASYLQFIATGDLSVLIEIDVDEEDCTVTYCGEATFLGIRTLCDENGDKVDFVDYETEDGLWTEGPFESGTDFPSSALGPFEECECEPRTIIDSECFIVPLYYYEWDNGIHADIATGALLPDVAPFAGYMPPHAHGTVEIVGGDGTRQGFIDRHLKCGTATIDNIMIDGVNVLPAPVVETTTAGTWGPLNDLLWTTLQGLGYDTPAGRGCDDERANGGKINCFGRSTSCEDIGLESFQVTDCNGRVWIFGIQQVPVGETRVTRVRYYDCNGDVQCEWIDEETKAVIPAPDPSCLIPCDDGCTTSEIPGNWCDISYSGDPEIEDTTHATDIIVQVKTCGADQTVTYWQLIDGALVEYTQVGVIADCDSGAEPEIPPPPCPPDAVFGCVTVPGSNYSVADNSRWVFPGATQFNHLSNGKAMEIVAHLEDGTSVNLGVLSDPYYLGFRAALEAAMPDCLVKFVCANHTSPKGCRAVHVANLAAYPAYDAPTFPADPGNFLTNPDSQELWASGWLWECAGCVSPIVQFEIVNSSDPDYIGATKDLIVHTLPDETYYMAVTCDGIFWKDCDGNDIQPPVGAKCAVPCAPPNPLEALIGDSCCDVDGEGTSDEECVVEELSQGEHTGFSVFGQDGAPAVKHSAFNADLTAAITAAIEGDCLFMLKHGDGATFIGDGNTSLPVATGGGVMAPGLASATACDGTELATVLGDQSTPSTVTFISYCGKAEEASGAKRQVLFTEDKCANETLGEIRDKLCEEDCTYEVWCDETPREFLVAVCPSGITILSALDGEPLGCTTEFLYCGRIPAGMTADTTTQIRIGADSIDVVDIAGWDTWTEAERLAHILTLVGAPVVAGPDAEGRYYFDPADDPALPTGFCGGRFCALQAWTTQSVEVCTGPDGTVSATNCDPEGPDYDVVTLPDVCSDVAGTLTPIQVYIDGEFGLEYYIDVNQNVVTEVGTLTPGACILEDVTTSVIAEGCYNGQPATLFIKSSCPEGECESVPAVNLLTNGELEGTAGISVLPTGWSQIPYTDPTSPASSSPRDTSDTTSLTGHNVSNGTAGTPHQGTSFVSSLLGSASQLTGFGEGLQQNVSGLVPGDSYSICFWQAVVQQSNATAQTGGWSVHIDNTLAASTAETTTTQTGPTDLNLNWEKRTVTFVATATSHDIKFGPWTTSSLALRMGIDDISLTALAAGASCCVDIDCVAVVLEGTTEPIVPDPALPISLVSCRTQPTVTTELEIEAVCAVVDGVKVPVWQVVETVYLDGVETSTNQYLADIDTFAEVIGTIEPCDPDVDLVSADVCDPKLGTLLAVTIDGTTTYYDPTNGQAVVPGDVNALLGGACPLPNQHLIEGCVEVDGELVDGYTLIDELGNPLFPPRALTTLGFKDCC